MPVAVASIPPLPAAPLKSFDKGITQGMLEPLHELVQPYSAFPKKITGKTVWRREDFLNDETLWKRFWTPENVASLEASYDAWAAKGLSLPEIDRETFPLSEGVRTFLAEIRETTVHGAGFILIKGLPVQSWPVEKACAVYLAIGAAIGVAVSQNHKGHILGHVKDLGNDPTQIDKVRIYTTTARQYFHTDNADIVGLLCLQKAKEGGESDVCSAHNLWNTLQAERPDVAELLARPDWYFDRKGEVSAGQKEWVQKAIFYYHDGRVISQYDPYYVKSIQRFIDAGLIPGHTDAQKEAIEVLEQTAQRLALHMVLDVGDIQFVGEMHNFHARTAYVDHVPPIPRRHLLRLWLSVPEVEGGWKRPYPDSGAYKRCGIQVNSQKETCPIDAE
ncbi:Clavaminate synthase-like protein [Cutaneotrichosporon oleaginosum]|uniref:Clavaminate synthase-like protein n=1 Tax=Cutaneotrichosporon oleaginosum TaxID=879819 RepID=A0A0J0XLZ8_9TREE|nr:Clavaminate synthase-like protein [Cutaneotrichosporon oleaginosum]KLT42132.1 Clavaminate synthase-like protein [Cutaneotrichosporon oleaginosum]TXT11743.1 hypothetical protein COLE_02153 [Cutaneotrichosporon oleaginosum]